MKVSIFTPFHKKEISFLHDLYASLKEQTCREWEWVLVANGEGLQADLTAFKEDKRIKIVYYNKTGCIGELKSFACLNCSNEILMEVDWDDLLCPSAVEEVRKAFENPEVGFVYSNTLITDMELGKREKYNLAHGWQYRETDYKGHLLDEPLSFDHSPAAVSRIWYAPDHLRAFRKDVYEKVGGYNPELKVLDDQDLMCRLYLETKFYHIDKGLYVYRVHGDNSWLTYNKEIQDGVYPLYDKYIEAMALCWAKNTGLRCIELGARLNRDERYTSLDLKDADIIMDLNHKWGHFDDSSVGVIKANDVFEHLKDPLHTMKELYRVLAPGGYAFIQVPSTDGRGAFQDPTHKSFWNENSFLYYTDQSWAQYIDTPVRFQAMRLYTTQPNDQKVCWTTAHLINLKDNYRPPGIKSI
jgi:glycosyltransferase involved in cell wall biosynthesis